MLGGTLAFLVLVACALAGAELRAALARRGVRAPAMEGLSFLVLGFLLGGRGLGLFADDLVASLRVVVLFGLAWIGLVFGVQLELKVIRRLSRRHRLLGVLLPSAMAAAVAAAGLAAGLEPPLACALGGIAAASSPTPLEGLSRGRRVADRTALQHLRLVMAFSGIPAVAMFAAATALASPLARAGVPQMAALELLFLIAALGVLVGYAVVVLLRGTADPIQVLTVLMGSMSLLAGATAVLGASALPAAACAGAVLINRCVFPHRVLRAAHSLERPMLVALLVLIGASWSAAAFSWPTLLLMTGVRGVAALLAGSVLDRQTGRGPGVRLARRLGWGLLPQGELALGLAVAIATFLPAAGVLEALLAAIVLNNLAGGWWMRRHLVADEGRGAGP